MSRPPAPDRRISSWTSHGSVLASAGVALAAKGNGIVVLIYAVTNGYNTDLTWKQSTNNGATWSSAAVITSEASAIGSIAVAFNPATGAACIFYTLGTTDTLKRLRGTTIWDGTMSWAASGTAWSKAGDAATLTGVAATYHSGDYALVVTGTAETTLRRKAWAYIMGDTLYPLNVWIGPTTIAESDSGSGTTYAGPAIVNIGDPFAGFAQVEAGNVAAAREMLAHPPATQLVNHTGWTEPAPHEADSAHGMAIATVPLDVLPLGRDITVWAATPSGVWRAVCYVDGDTGPHNVSARLVAASYRITPTSARARFELDNADGALNALPNDDFPCLFVGGQLQVLPGYKSDDDPAGGQQYGVAPIFTIERLTYRCANDGRAVVIADCGGPWEAVSSWRAPQAWQTAAGVLTRDALFQRIAAKAGYAVNQVSYSAEWTAYSPAFAVAAAESGASVLQRLLAVVSDHVRPDSAAFTIVGLAADDDPSADYGGAGNHPITTLDYFDAAPDANWTRLTGPDRYADAVDAESVYAVGPRLRHLRNLDAGTDAKAIAGSAAVLRRDAIAQPFGQLIAPFHCGQELYDVITITEPHLGLDETPARVLAIGLDYRRSPKGTRGPRWHQPDARFDITLDLGGL